MLSAVLQRSGTDTLDVAFGKAGKLLGVTLVGVLLRVPFFGMSLVGVLGAIALVNKSECGKWQDV